jgi:hypothetical protein
VCGPGQDDVDGPGLEVLHSGIGAHLAKLHGVGITQPAPGQLPCQIDLQPG